MIAILILELAILFTPTVRGGVFNIKALANSTKMCYTYDNLSRVTARTVKKLSDNSVVSTETFSYDAAGNITDAPDSCFQYDTNNRLVVFNGDTVSYDLDGNMLSNGSLLCTYDSANRLVTADGHTYTYNAEDVRIRNLCADEDTTYTYDTNCKLSQLLTKTTDSVVTKYVYGRGLIGEEVNNTFKTYHFDCRGSTIAITDISGNITDTFAYDTYGKLVSRTGTSDVIFCYNGRDGVVTDKNGLLYMRARYYSPDMKRFINADIVAGAISNAITLNRFAYANGNPVSFVDPFGLSVWSWIKDKYNDAKDWVSDTANDVKDWAVDTYNSAKDAVVETYNNAKDFVVNTYNDAKQVVVETYNEVKDWAVDTYNDVKNWAVNTYTDVKNWAVDTYNDTKETVKNAATWVDTNVIKPTGEVLSNAGRQIKDGFVNTAKKVGNSFINAIEAKVLLGFGLGVSGEDCGAEVSKSIVIGIDDGAEYCGYEVNAEIGVGIIGFSSSHTHLSERDYSPIRCDSEHAYERKTIFNILSCPDTIHSNSFNIGPFSIASNGDVSLSLQGSIFAIVGVGGSVGINLSEFVRGVFE